VSARTGEGLGELRAALEVPPHSSGAGTKGRGRRLQVDRSFTLKGTDGRAGDAVVGTIQRAATRSSCVKMGRRARVRRRRCRPGGRAGGGGQRGAVNLCWQTWR